MSIEVRQGDLFASGASGLAHGCNCRGVMGAGIAKSFRDRWPEMYAEYRERCQTGRFILGEVFAYETGNWPTNGIVIFNLATQLDPGPHANLYAIEQSVTTMLALARERVVEEVALPRIGAGIGGLDWAEVQRTLEACAAKVPEVSLVVCEL